MPTMPTRYLHVTHPSPSAATGGDQVHRGTARLSGLGPGFLSAPTPQGLQGQPPMLLHGPGQPPP